MSNVHQHHGRFGILALLVAVILLAACVRPSTRKDPVQPTSQPYIPVTLAAPTLAPTSTPEPTPTLEANDPDCIDNLTYVDDLTIQDGTTVAPGETLDKRWQVKNSGTCHWGEGYEIRFTGGVEMGAASPQSLFPARAGSEATIQIFFTAPADPGEYRSAWSAYNPDGIPFGEPVYIYIVVEAP